MKSNVRDTAQRHGGQSAVEDRPVETQEQEQEQPQATTSQEATQTANFVLTFKRNHPQDRASYGVPGNPGIVVIQRGLIKGALPFKDMNDRAGLPETITLNIELVQPKTVSSTAKADALAERLAARAKRDQERADKAKMIAEEKARKAQDALDKAKARIVAAQVKTAPDGNGGATA